MRLPAEQVVAEPPGAGADDGGAETESAGSGASGVDGAAELTAADGVTLLSPLSAPPPSGWHPDTASAAEATMTANAEPRTAFMYRMLSPVSQLSGAWLFAAPSNQTER
ncbi:hypothetical protein [Streptomyces justiciae]|uniref:hypothetical protein n=1 Tax=Streptomyces justiciae TaxID=2780140 RepID=UPI002AD1F370|nr:hypothetical protein [Streptomyces justiciae]